MYNVTSVNIHYQIQYHNKIKHKTDLCPRLRAPVLQYSISELVFITRDMVYA